MLVSADDYGEMREWLGRVAREVFPAELQTKETDPLTALDAIASRSPAKAREGLSMAIGDLVELTSGWSDAQVALLNCRLAAEGLATLSAVRARFSKAVQRIVRRGRINDEVEYYAVRNAAEQSGNAEGQLWELLATYEGRVAS